MRIRVPSVLLALSVLSTLPVFVPAARAADAAYERDLIARLEAAFTPAGPLAVDGIPVHRTCASPLLLETRLRWPDLSAATRARIAGVVAFDRPVLPEFYDTPDGLFRIHYARTGSDSVNLSFGIGPNNVPNYVLNCAEILKHAYAKQVDTLGFRAPVSDQIPRPGENPLFDVYFQMLSTTFYGLTYPDTLINNGAGNPWWATSWMVLHSDYTKLSGYESRPFDAMEVTAAHELNHAIQWSYDAFEAEERVEGGSLKSFPWWLEVSATAMEELVFDDVNDYYGYLPFWFNNPNVSLRAFSNSASVDGLHPYASVIWALYLAETQGPEILTEIWEEAGEVDGFNTFAAFDSVLTRRGTTFRDAWGEFLVWNYFTGDRAVSWNYDEAASYPEFDLPNSLRYDEFPVADTSDVSNYPKSPDELAAAYLRFGPVASDTALTFKIAVNPHQPANFGDWTVVTAGLTGTLKPDIQVWDIFETIEVPGWDAFDEILVIATPFKLQPTPEDFDRRLGFRFEVADTLNSGGTQTAIRKIYSNPLELSAGGEAVFQVDVSRADAVPVSLRIYTLDGREVRGGAKDNDAANLMHLEAGRTTATMRWNGTTSAGEPVATGIYLALVQFGNQSEVLKVAVKNRIQ